jgi:group II intron reverse transcriptase/maturase
MANSKRARRGKPLIQPRGRAYLRSNDLQSALERIRQAARLDKQLRFTSLWHHVYNVDRLRRAYKSLKRRAAPGVDGETWQHYGEDLEANLRDLSARLRRGAYRAKPVKRTYIPKPDGRQRPIGVPALEDKIVQRATVEVLNAIYETDFKGFSYGFRPGRGPHDALDALTVGIEWRKVNWVLDADIRGFFDAIDHEWLERFVEHRIGDPRVVRHVKKWLRAGVLEDGEWRQVEEGTPQGGSISPLLANVYLHYVFDLWIDQWRKSAGRGDVIVVRFADDFVIGFQHRETAEQCLAELRERFKKFKLELHPDKTRLIEFGRFAADRRKRRGDGKPETFDFLGFTHICGKSRKGGRFTIRRHTMRKRLHRKVREVREELYRRRHEPTAVIGQWLRTILVGHYRYYGVPHNSGRLSAFRYYIVRAWQRALRRRSQKDRTIWVRMDRLADRWLPVPRIQHPYPAQRLCV